MQQNDYCMHIQTVCNTLIQLFRQLRYLHQTNWIHRDIKPGNIMFGLGPFKQ